MTYLQLFLSFLQIGALSFGGGYAAMPLIQEQIVTRHGWLSMGEFTDLVTIAEMTPGPIAINAATFVGTRVAGIPGAMAATVGCILPACILVTLIARLYLKYRDLAVLQGVLGSLRPGGRGDDRLCRHPDPAQRLLGRRGRDACGHKLGHGRHLCRVLCAAARHEAQPDRGHAAGRRGESARLHPAVFKMRCAAACAQK